MEQSCPPLPPETTQPHEILQSIEETCETMTTDTPTTTSPPSDEHSQVPQPPAPRRRSRIKESLHTPEKWESMRKTIRQLYIEENQTLTKVSEFLNKEHDFVATPKQFKIRFKLWGFVKNLNSQHASSLLEMKESRDLMGKSSAFRRSGRQLDLDRIRKTIRRSKCNRALSKEDSPENEGTKPAQPVGAAQSLPVGIEIRTPSPETEPREDGLFPSDPTTSVNSDIFKDGCSCGFVHTPDCLFPHGALAGKADLSASEVYTFKESISQAEQQSVISGCEHEIDLLYDITMSKISLHMRPPDLSADLDAARRDFQYRTRLLAISETAPLCQRDAKTLLLENFAEAFGCHPQTHSFVYQHVLPALTRDHTEGAVAMAPGARLVQVIRNGLSLLNSFPMTQDLIETGGTRYSMGDEQYSMGDEQYTLHDSIIVPELFNAHSPSTETSLSMPATPALDGSIPWPDEVFSERTVPSAPQDPDADDELARAIDLAVATFNLGNSVSAMGQLHNITSQDAATTRKGKVLTRMAWYCLSGIYRQSGLAIQAEGCLKKAVCGTTYFRNDKGQEWDEVKHLFM